MFCTNCGTKLRKTDKFCSNCGTPVTINQTNEWQSTDEINDIEIDLSQFGKDKVAACKYVSHTYNLSLTDAKKIVDKKYKEQANLEVALNNNQSSFHPTQTIDCLQVDSNNKLFKVKGQSSNAYQKRKKTRFIK